MLRNYLSIYLGPPGKPVARCLPQTAATRHLAALLSQRGRMRGGVLVLALLGSAGAFIVSPTIGPLARRGFVAPSTPVVPDRALPVATAELPKETNTFSKSSEPGSVCPDPDVH